MQNVTLFLSLQIICCPDTFDLPPLSVSFEKMPQDKTAIYTMGDYSRERARERNYILFVWQLAEGLVTGYDLIFYQKGGNRECKVDGVDESLSKMERRKKEASLGVKGAKLFNLLPMRLRNFSGDLESFTTKIDSFLSKIPDSPRCPLRECVDEKNSLLYLLSLYREKDINVDHL